MSRKRDAIRRNEEYEEDRPRYFTATVRNEPRSVGTEDVVQLLQRIGWDKAACMVRRQAEEAAARMRDRLEAVAAIGRLQARINELDPPIADGMRYTGD